MASEFLVKGYFTCLKMESNKKMEMVLLNGGVIQSCSHGGEEGKLQWLWRFVS